MPTKPQPIIISGNSAVHHNDNRPKWFDALLLAHEPYIRKRITLSGRTGDDAEDVFQNVMLKAIELWQSFRRTGNFAGWIHWIVFRVIHKEQGRPAIPATAARYTEPTQDFIVDIARAVEVLPYEVILAACGHSKKDIGDGLCITGAGVIYRIKAARARYANDNDVKNNKAA